MYNFSKSLFINLCLLCFLFSASSLVQAQSEESNAKLEEVVVTGTHIRRADQQFSISPLTTVNAEDISVQGAKDISDIIRNLTINTGAELNVSGLNQPQTAGTAQINLRGLGLGSTLVLANGRRQTLSAVAKQDDGSSFVDTNSLYPLIMIERIDVLKDGASATYGSDAVAGVANFITHKSFEGLKTSLEFQTENEKGSYDEIHAGLMFGSPLENGHMVIAASYFDRNPMLAGDRSWADGTALSSLGNPGGFSTSAGFVADPECGANGTFVRFGGLFCGMDITPFFDLMPEEERINLAGNISLEMSDKTTLFMEAGYAKNEGLTRATPSYPILRRFPVASATDPDNPFAENATFFGRILGPEGMPTEMPYEYQTSRISLEIEHMLNSGWIMDSALSYSKNTADVGNGDTVISRLEAALAGNGGPSGNERYSLFGVSSQVNSKSLIDHILQPSYQEGDSSLVVYEVIFSNTIGNTQYGEIGLALGGQYRDEKLSVDLDDFLNADDFYTLPGGEDFSTSRDAISLFAEASIPIAETVEVQLAARYEDYGDNLDSVDPKIGILWMPLDNFSLRASFSTAFRVATLLQSNGRLGANAVINDSINGLSGLFRTINTSGNSNLKPEEADVFNIGFSWQPSEILDIDFDYWSFDYSNIIVKESAQGLVNQASADFLNGLSNTEALNKVVRTNSSPSQFGFISQINSDFVNAPSLETSGFDFNASLEINSHFSLNANFTKVSDYEIQTNTGNKIDGAGSRNASNFARPVPELRGYISLDWEKDQHRFTIFSRQIDDYEDDLTGSKIDAHSTLDFRYSFSIGNNQSTQISLGAINALNEDPPSVSTFIGFDVQTHDPRGRMIYVSLSHNF
jgi:iron complex outermembrane receptor protein